MCNDLWNFNVENLHLYEINKGQTNKYLLVNFILKSKILQKERALR